MLTVMGTDDKGVKTVSTLRDLRVARGWSQGRLLLAMEARAATDNVSLASRPSLKVALSRWENGHQRPDGVHRQLLAHVFGVPLSDLGFSYPADATSSVGRLCKVTPEVISYYDSVFGQYVLADQLLGPQHVRDVVVAQLKQLDSTRAQATGAMSVDLLRLTVRYAELVGWLSQDSGDLTAAERWTRLATDRATMLGEPDLSAYVAVRRSVIASEDGRVQDAVDFAALAQRTAAALPPTTQALAHRQVAVASALAQDEKMSRRAIDLAMVAVTDDSPDPLDPGHYCSRSYVHMEAAQALSHVGAHEDALAHLTEAVEAWPQGQPRDRALCLARTADLRARTGDIEEACRVAHQALTEHEAAPSARTGRTLRGLRNRLVPHRRNHMARDAMDSLAAVG